MILPNRFACILLFFASNLFAQNWIAPTPAELAMTAQPEVPGATAVYLNREEIANDFLHVFTIYARIKVLTDAGKDLANVEVAYATGVGGTTVDAVAGRTIHADGTIIPFSGKPYEKLVSKGQDRKVMQKIFTLPSVEVGSILEYRYQLRYDDNYVRSPDWYVQSEFYTRNAHFLWIPTSRDVISEVDGKNVTSSIAWTPILPPGAEVKQIANPGSSAVDRSQTKIELTVHNIPPIPREEYMPPLDSVSYRVLFYYTSFRNVGEYWKSAGKRWSRDQDRFIGPGKGVAEAVQKMVSPGDTSEQKLRKFYNAVMEMENTDFTREHTSREDKAAGLRDVKNTDDILARKRGSSDQLSDLFVAMARASGFKAYAMGVADRQRRLFIPNYLSSSQLDDDIAIVNVDGTERYFDPGTRYCAFGHVSWRHASSGGLRQTDGATLLATVPGESYKSAHVTRVADLKLDDTGLASGTVKFTFTGDPALRWRHEALRGDETSLNRELREQAERLLPGGMEVRVTKVEHLAEYELPLVVSYDVKGAVGAPAGKRLLIPSALFEANTKPRFPQEKRDLAVDMHYADSVQDAVRIKLPPTLAVESLPATGDATLPKQAIYKLSSEQTSSSFTVRRDLMVGEALFLPSEYPSLRTFYNKLQTKDQESVVLIRTSDAEHKPATPGT